MTMKLYGPMGRRFEANLKNWLLTAPFENPGMLGIYFRRNEPHQEIVPWYGEFSGKYLTSAALVYQMQPEESLRQICDYVVEQLAKAQDTDGYLGVWPDSQKLKGMTPKGDKTWDAWSHYHNMLGLLLWYEVSGSEAAREVLNKVAACLYNFYIVQNHPLDEDKDGTDAAVGHIFALLYLKTKDPRYLEIVQKTFRTFEEESGGDYFRAGLQGLPFYQMKRTRWECLHAIQTIKAMYDITGEEKYKQAFIRIWHGIARYDRHNTGGFSSGERACGNPYDPRAIETCCTIAWMVLTQDMLALSDSSIAADELELSTWNALLGAQQPSGRSFTYNTPMAGDRKASAHEIVFQVVAGSSELNCCSVNGPRGFGMIGTWAVTMRDRELTVNYYGPSKTEIRTKEGGSIRIVQSGNYPFAEDLTLRLETDDQTPYSLRLRIPFWSAHMVVHLNGQLVQGAEAGTYCLLEQVRSGDVVELRMDMTPHYWQGSRDAEGKTSIYAGPILLACDQRFNQGKCGPEAPLSLSHLKLSAAVHSDGLFPQPDLLVKASDGEHSVILCDFASAGQTGTLYDTWLLTQPELPVLSDFGDVIPWGQRLTKGVNEC